MHLYLFPPVQITLKMRYLIPVTRESGIQKSLPHATSTVLEVMALLFSFQMTDSRWNPFVTFDSKTTGEIWIRKYVLQLFSTYVVLFVICAQSLFSSFLFSSILISFFSKKWNESVFESTVIRSHFNCLSGFVHSVDVSSFFCTLSFLCRWLLLCA